MKTSIEEVISDVKTKAHAAQKVKFSSKKKPRLN
jgi:hypothetical protein